MAPFRARIEEDSVLWLIPLALLIILVLGAVLAGMTLPREHLVSRTLQLRESREQVHACLADLAGYPGWRPGLRAMEPTGEGAWREVPVRGGDVELRVVESTPPERLVWVLGGPRGGFCGIWQFDLAPGAPGCWVTLTERSAAAKPLVRFALRYLWARSRVLERFLGDLAARFGQAPVLE